MPEINSFHAASPLLDKLDLEVDAMNFSGAKPLVDVDTVDDGSLLFQIITNQSDDRLRQGIWEPKTGETLVFETAQCTRGITRRLATIAAAAVLAAAAVPARANEQLGATQQPMRSPYPVPVELQEDLGLVSVDNSRCSGSLLTNEWVLTAAHCITNAALTVTSAWGGPSGQIRRRIDAVVFEPFDLAIVRMDRPFRKNGTTKNFFAPIDTVGVSNDGNSILVFGQGLVTFARSQNGIDIPAQGGGSYRSGPFQLGGIRHGVFDYPSGAVSAMGGDSGGPSYRTSETGLRGALIGVQSTCRPTGYIPGKPKEWVWATGIAYCTAISVHPHLQRMRDEIATRQSVAAPAERRDLTPNGGMVISNPQLESENGVRLLVDNCLAPGTQCGRPAADAYCKMVDPRFAGASKWARTAPGAFATTIIQQSQECRGPVCVGFSMVQCSPPPDRRRAIVRDR